MRCGDAVQKIVFSPSALREMGENAQKTAILDADDTDLPGGGADFADSFRAEQIRPLAQSLLAMNAPSRPSMTMVCGRLVRRFNAAGSPFQWMKGCVIWKG